MRYKLLIVDKDYDSREELSNFFKTHNFIVEVAADGVHARSMVINKSFDIAVIDSDILGINGFELCRWLKKTSNIKVILTSNKKNENYELQAFLEGADDFFYKGSSKEVLLARVKRFLTAETNYNDELKIGDVLLNFENLTVKVQNQYIELTKMEFLILKYLFENSNIIKTREAIIESIRGNDFFGDLRVVDTHIKNIRKKIGQETIVTVKGLGYLVREKKY